MNSLWTPGGEHEVPREGQQPPAAEGPPEGFPDDISFDDLSPEEQEQARQMAAELAEARVRVAETPASVVVANHVMGLYELGAIHLSNNPPNLPEARIAVDAMTGVLGALEGRMGEHEATLQEALAQIQMAFVTVTNAQNAEGAAAGEEPASNEPAADG